MAVPYYPNSVSGFWSSTPYYDVTYSDNVNQIYSQGGVPGGSGSSQDSSDFSPLVFTVLLVGVLLVIFK